MKKLVWFLFFCFIAQAQAAITAGEHKCAGSTDDNAVTTAAINTVGASLIIVEQGVAVGVTPPTPTDSSSNTYTCLATQTYTAVMKGRLCYVENPATSSSHTFTSPSTSMSFPGICAMAFFGTKLPATALDQQAHNNTDGGGTTIQPGSVTPSENGELVFTGLVDVDTGTVTVNSPFSPAIDQTPATAHAEGVAIAYEIQTTATARNPTWTNSGAAAAKTADITTWKAQPSANSSRPGALVTIGVGR